MHSPAEEPTPHLTRRSFCQTGGALFVSALFASTASAQAKAGPDPTLLASWLEIRSDNTILVRTGRAETGTGMSGFYAQVVAEELCVAPESITLLMGDTDRTPDGGYSAGFLTGAANLRKVSAYTYQALLELASAQLGAPVEALAVAAGVVTGAGKSITYGRLVGGQNLDLRIPVSGNPTRMDPASNWGVAGLDGIVVTGNPATKPMSSYTVVGKSYPMPGVPDKVTGKTQWCCDVPVPGLEGALLHARMLRPATLGSTLIAPGALDKKRFPTAEVVRKNNLLAVVSPDEWEAITAARAVTGTTRWTAWAGLPGSDNVTRTLREHPWGPPDGSRGNPDKVATAISSAPRTIAASYEQAYVRHAPIGPFVAVADVRKDGAVTVWTHSAHSQGLRAQIANTLSISTDKVVVRWLDGPGQYGRTTHAGDGAEADAVILSQLTGRPVRVQWSLEEDLAWSSVSPAWVADIRAGLDSTGRITAIGSRFFSPHMFDARLLGAILAGLPVSTSKTKNWLAVEWIYDRIATRLEQVHGRTNIGAETPAGGLRGNIMRTPGHRQQNFVVESLMSEAAAAARVDPIQFRRNHMTDKRMLALLDAVAEAAGWQERPSPKQGARTTGSEPLTGRGVGIILRDRAYWAGIAEITVVPATGLVQVTKFTVGADCGKILNPRQLDRCMRGGLLMGISEALKEEVTFDKQRVTSTDWSRYRILTMAETPEIRVVQISQEDQGFGVGGEAANALGPSAIAAALFDATGVFPRQLPLTPQNVMKMLTV